MWRDLWHYYAHRKFEHKAPSWIEKIKMIHVNEILNSIEPNVTYLASQRETVLSPDPVQIFVAYGWNFTEFTESTWPRRVSLHLIDQQNTKRLLIEAVTKVSPAQHAYFDEFKSHSLAVWSIEADTRKSPLWWKSTPQVACVWSAEKKPLIERIACDWIAAWIKKFALTAESCHRWRWDEIPQLDDTITSGGCKMSSSWMKGHVC